MLAQVQEAKIVLVRLYCKTIEPVVYHQPKSKEGSTLEILRNGIRLPCGCVDTHEMEIFEVCFARAVVDCRKDIINELGDGHLLLYSVAIYIRFVTKRDTSVVLPKCILQCLKIWYQFSRCTVNCCPVSSCRPSLC